MNVLGVWLWRMKSNYRLGTKLPHHSTWEERMEASQASGPATLAGLSASILRKIEYRQGWKNEVLRLIRSFYSYLGVIQCLPSCRSILMNGFGGKSNDP